MSKALEAVNLVQEAVREAQDQVSTSYKSALDENESRVAKAVFPTLERLQAARGIATFARHIEGCLRPLHCGTAETTDRLPIRTARSVV